jgi:hypothetical protein
MRLNLLKKQIKIQKFNLLISTSGICIMFCQLIIQIFANWIRLIYPKEFEIKETTETAYSASLLDIYYHFNLLLENEMRTSKFKVICPPWVSNTMKPNLRLRIRQRWKEETSDWQVNIFERPTAALLIPYFSIQWSQSRITQNNTSSPGSWTNPKILVDCLLLFLKCNITVRCIFRSRTNSIMYKTYTEMNETWHIYEKRVLAGIGHVWKFG